MKKALALMMIALPVVLVLAAACGGGSGGSSGGGPTASSGTISLSAGDNFFEYKGKKNPNIVVKAGSETTLEFTNKGKALHNLRIAGLSGSFDAADSVVSKPSPVAAGGKGSISFKLDRPGSYKFHCDFHPESTGTITVES